MSVSNHQLKFFVGIAAIVAPSTQTLTDLFKWTEIGYSIPLFWINYLGLLLLTFTVVGLYAVQRPKISYWGLVGALLYATTWIYFAHTSLYVLAEAISTNQELVGRLGSFREAQGMIMILSGVIFGVSSYRANVFPNYASVLFLVGLGLNFLSGVMDASYIVQVAGSGIRNLGIVCMGIFLVLEKNTSANVEIGS